MAYLRGAYDADGFSNRTSLSSFSREYLKQIRDIFNIPYPVRLHKERYSYLDTNGNLHVRKSHWVLTLGVNLFKEMTNLCSDYGLDLKRKNK
ncbi:MAG: hypothetical protein ACFFB4_04370 [Promethearchaeota archaeon]